MAGLMSGETAVQTGLGLAAERINAPANSAYPSYVSSATTNPATAAYYNYTPTTPMATITAPDYKLTAGSAPTYNGLMGGDYDKLQQSLYQPAQIAANTAYQQGYNNLTNVMGGNGLYGSSIMANQATNNLDTVYQNALATAAANAAAQRYGMQATDLANQNTFNKDIYGLGLSQEQALNKYNQANTQLGMAQNLNQWQAQNTSNQQLNAYNQAKQAYDLQQRQNQINWQNQQAYEQYQYQLAQQAYQNQLRSQGITEALALAGNGNGAYSTAMNAQNQADRLASAENAGYWNAAGGLLGAALSQPGQNAISSLYGWLGGLGGGGGYYDPSYVTPDFTDYTDWTNSIYG